jgi:hypothetical protein
MFRSTPHLIRAGLSTLLSGDVAMWNVTTVGMILGSAVIVAALVIALRRNDFPKNAYVFLGIGSFLIAGSQWTSFKLSKDGIEVLRQKVELTASQVQQTTKAVAATQTQVASLSSQLADNNVLSSRAREAIYERLAEAPPSDSYRLTIEPVFARMDTVGATAATTTTTKTTTKKKWAAKK